jgi:large subunit ribosomal protein L17
MRHRVAGVKLNRTAAHRRALFRNLVTALLEHEAVRTTDAKAKELKRWGDRLITLGKDGTLHARRRAAALIPSATVVRKLFTELGPRYAGRNGGYTRVVKLGVRVGDAAPLSVVELVDRGGAAEAEQAPKKKPARRRKTAEAAATDQPKKKPATRRRAAAG